MGRGEYELTHLDVQLNNGDLVGGRHDGRPNMQMIPWVDRDGKKERWFCFLREGIGDSFDSLLPATISAAWDCGGGAPLCGYLLSPSGPTCTVRIG